MPLGVPSIFLCCVEAVGCKRQSGPSDDTLRMARQGREGVTRRGPRLDCRIENCPALGRLVPATPKNITYNTVAIAGLSHSLLAAKTWQKPALALTPNDTIAVDIPVRGTRRTNYEVSRLLRCRLGFGQVGGSPPTTNSVFYQGQSLSKSRRFILGRYTARRLARGGQMSDFRLGFIHPAGTDRQGEDRGKCAGFLERILHRSSFGLVPRNTE